jgi:NADP-dependent aldehyde dehydrogenase
MSETPLDEVGRRAERAAEAAGACAAATAAERARWLHIIAERLEGDADALVALADRETALGADRLRGELHRTTGQLRLFAEVVLEGSYLEATIDRAAPTAGPPRPDLRRMLRPVGPVAVFAASNFPFAFSVAGGDTASALAVGCPVVVKAHSGHPALSRRVADRIADALSAAAAPEGAFGLVEGHDAGIALIEHPAVRAAAFTGSLAGGRALADRAAARAEPIPFFGELGSVNPVIVTPGADRERGTALAEGLAASFQLGAGQFCTKPGLVFVPRGSALERELPTLVGSEGRRLLTESIDHGFRTGMARLADMPATELVAGRTPAPAHAPTAAVFAVELDELDDPRNGPVLREEVFGPVTVLVRYTELDELPAALARLDGSLTATIHLADGEPVDDILDVAERRAGRILFEGWPTGVAVTWGQHHGGPWPATTSQHTSVGATAVRRFLRPIAYQDAPEELLPAALRDGNPLGIPRRVDGVIDTEETP